MTKIRALVWVGATLTATFVGCAGPLRQDSEQRLHDDLINSHRAYLSATATAGPVQVSQPASDVETVLTPERRKQLDAMSGVGSYANDKLNLGSDLTGADQEDKYAGYTLQHCIELAVRYNLDSKIASLQPGIDQSKVTQALAAFDAEFFVQASNNRTDTPQPPLQGTVNPAFGTQQSNTQQLTTGIRKMLSTGGTLSVQTDVSRKIQNPSFYRVNKWYDADASVTLKQPLLRNFGSDVTNANINLARNAQASAVQDFKRQLLESVANTEQTYWDLYYSRQRLLIQLRLLERTVEDRARLRARGGFDASPLRLAEANSFVEFRRAEIVRARNEVRSNSDKLKKLINDPSVPVASETVILPLDQPTAEPVTFDLQDSVTTAMRHRPELQRLLLEIKDAGVRQRVADNLRLPDLTLEGTVRANGLGLNGYGDAYSGENDSLGQGKFIDYLLSLQFTVPIGNRGPEALFLQRRLERQAAIVNYQRGTQQVVLDVKDTLRNIRALYSLLSINRAARLAASDNLRVIQEQEEAGVALTPEFLLDLKLNAQQRLAEAESSEIRSLSDYNTAIARLYQAQGTLLSRNGIDFQENTGEPTDLPSALHDPLGLEGLVQSIGRPEHSSPMPTVKTNSEFDTTGVTRGLDSTK